MLALVLVLLCQVLLALVHDAPLLVQVVSDLAPILPEDGFPALGTLPCLGPVQLLASLGIVLSLHLQLLLLLLLFHLQVRGVLVHPVEHIDVLAFALLQSRPIPGVRKITLEIRLFLVEVRIGLRVIDSFHLIEISCIESSVRGLVAGQAVSTIVLG